MNTQTVCKRCLMDVSVPRIRFDADGICNHCHFHDLLEADYPLGEVGKRRLDAMYENIRRLGHGHDYDCVVGISGGRDSTYTLYHLVKEVGLRCLAVHFNDGFGNPLAGENMQRVTKTLGVSLRTISADWRESKDLKLACLKASVPDLNLATDMGIGNALYGVAAAENIRTVVIGQSFRTEGIAPLEWNYLDGLYLRSIHQRFGQFPLRPWKPGDPGFNMDWYHVAYYALWRRIQVAMPLYHMNYIRKDVDQVIEREVGWKNPGAHYFDDLFQSVLTYVLRVKFGIDRRRHNYSALIRSGQMSREEGLERIAQPYVIEDPKIIQLCIKRLGLSQEEFDAYLALPPKTFWDYPNRLRMLRLARPAVKVLASMNLVPKSSYIKYCTGDI